MDLFCHYLLSRPILRLINSQCHSWGSEVDENQDLLHAGNEVCALADSLRISADVICDHIDHDQKCLKCDLISIPVFTSMYSGKKRNFLTTISPINCFCSLWGKRLPTLKRINAWFVFYNLNGLKTFWLPINCFEILILKVFLFLITVVPLYSCIHGITWRAWHYLLGMHTTESLPGLAQWTVRMLTCQQPQNTNRWTPGWCISLSCLSQVNMSVLGYIYLSSEAVDRLYKWFKIL